MIDEKVQAILKGTGKKVYLSSIGEEKDCLGLFHAPPARQVNSYKLGGQDCSITKEFAYDVQIVGSESHIDSQELAQQTYNILRDYQINSNGISFFKMLDDEPICIGRNDENICNFLVRTNVIYYI